MATQLPIPSGPRNREIIDRAYRACGIKDALFERTAEEYADGIDLLDDMMLESPFDKLGFVSGDDGEGNRVEDESGIDRKWLQAVALSLAERLAPVIGKTLSPHVLKAKVRSYSILCTSVIGIPDAQYADGAPRGAGARYRNWAGFGPFFPNDGDEEEEATVTTTTESTDIDSLPSV